MTTPSGQHVEIVGGIKAEIGLRALGHAVMLPRTRLASAATAPCPSPIATCRSLRCDAGHKMKLDSALLFSHRP